MVSFRPLQLTSVVLQQETATPATLASSSHRLHWLIQTHTLGVLADKTNTQLLKTNKQTNKHVEHQPSEYLMHTLVHILMKEAGLGMGSGRESGDEASCGKAKATRE